MTDAAFIAVDWGTTNRRIYLIGDDGRVLDTKRDDRGTLSIDKADWPQAIAEIRSTFGDLPLIAAGMIGSTRGWQEVPYVDCPADLKMLAQNLAWIEPGRTAIVPGVAQRDSAAPDVMRGEEVQLLGAVAAGLVPADALLCQPGTHCKWARMEGGRIVWFRTAMTGEMFAMLKAHSLLSDYLDGDVAPGADFTAGVGLAQRRQLLTDLFGQRAQAVLGLCPASIAARTSGLLIGTDVVEQRLQPGDSLYVLADPALGNLYADAIAACGAKAILIDSHAAFASGMYAIWKAAR